MCSNCDEMSLSEIKSEMLADTVSIFHRMADADLMFELAASCVSKGNELLEEQRVMRELEREMKQVLFNEVLRVSRHKFQELFVLLAKMIDNGDLEFEDAMAFCAEAIKEKQENSEVSFSFRF